VRLVLLTALSAALVACSRGDADTDDTDTDADTDSGADTADDDEDDGPFRVKGTVTGLRGTGLQLELNGEEVIDIDEDGSFRFDTRLDEGDDWEVRVVGTPSCPVEACVLDDDEGEMKGRDLELEVTCGPPRTRLFTVSWGSSAIRVTDDLNGYADGASATTREVVGDQTGLGRPLMDSLAYDPVRDLLYIANDDAVLVFAEASTIEGNVAPVRSFYASGSKTIYSNVEYDVTRDRLYVGSGWGGLHIFDDVKDADGAVEGSIYVKTESAVGSVSLDRQNDRLYLGGDYNGRVDVFDGASTLTSDSEADRALTWNGSTEGFAGPATIAIDGCTDRLWIGSNSVTTAGYGLVALDAASTLDGGVDFDEDYAFAFSGDNLVVLLDDADRLYRMPDSPAASPSTTTRPRCRAPPRSWSAATCRV
jgi:hypothetical protein